MNDANTRREYAWNYFQLHAGQRMSLFNFYIVISALLTAGIAESLRKDCCFQLLSFFLGLCLIIASFVFCRLDKRVGMLIKNAETALKDCERNEQNNNNNENTALFCNEEKNTNELKMARNKHIYLRILYPITYPECFRLVYVVFSLIGIASMVLSIIS